MALKPAGRGIEVFAVYLLFLALTTITVALRVYCRAHIQKAFGTDDYFAVLAWVGHLRIKDYCRRERLTCVRSSSFYMLPLRSQVSIMELVNTPGISSRHQSSLSD